MSSKLEKQKFDHSGPKHLTKVNWEDEDHRRCVAASLVRGVTILEKDRHWKRKGTDALAPPWWKTFDFELLRKLEDARDGSIFGAIYEFMPAFDMKNHKCPHYVIAFRGTITKGDSISITEIYTIVRDLLYDLEIMRNKLERRSRFKTAMDAVRETVDKSTNTWLAGHSLGAAMGMLAGKTMAKENIFLEAFLFNPPFVSLSNFSTERIEDEVVKQVVQTLKCVAAAGIIVFLKDRQQRKESEDLAVALSKFVPHLFVHPDDPICSGNIGYFGRRNGMENIKLGRLERLSAQFSPVNFLRSVIGKELEEPLHRIPSANLIVNTTRVQEKKRAHGLLQWLRPDLKSRSQVHKYRQQAL